MQRWTFAIALVLPTSALACSACSTDHSSQTLDAGDAGLKGDSSLDGDATDDDVWVPFDAGGVDPFVGSWGPLPGDPTSCGVKIDYAPAKDISPFTWKACASSRAGCSRLDIDWTKSAGTTIRFPDHPWRVVGGTSYLNYTRVFPRPSSANFTAAFVGVVATLDGVAGFAHGTFAGGSGFCDGHLAMSENGVRFNFMSSADLAFFVGAAPYGSPKGLAFHRHTQADFQVATGPNGGGVERVAATNTTQFFNMSQPFTITLYDSVSDIITFVPAQGPKIQAELPIAVPGGAVALDEESTRGLVYISLAGAAKKVYVPFGGEQVYSLDADATAGGAFVWLQGVSSGFGYKSISLWTSPYTTTTAVPRRVTGIDANPIGALVANAGMALLLNDYNQAELVRLSDGAAWTIAPEPGEVWVQPVGVDADEVWLASGPAQFPGEYETGLVKLKRADLGAPTVPPK